MESTNVRQIKATLVEQAFLGSTRVSCHIGPIVAARQEKGAPLGDDPWLGPLVPSGECEH
jgi:hypothetical protein